MLQVDEDRPMSERYRLPVIFGQNCTIQQFPSLFATAKLLVLSRMSQCCIILLV